MNAASSSSRIFVGGISWKADEASLRSFFETFGPVTECKIIMDKNTGCSKGYGFVTFADPETSETVKSQSTLYFMGKMMNVGDAYRKTDQQNLRQPNELGYNPQPQQAPHYNGQRPAQNFRPQQPPFIPSQQSFPRQQVFAPAAGTFNGGQGGYYYDPYTQQYAAAGYQYQPYTSPAQYGRYPAPQPSFNNYYQQPPQQQQQPQVQQVWRPAQQPPQPVAMQGILGDRPQNGVPLQTTGQ